jgi:hypothetical protein
MLTKMFGHKREELTEDWRLSHDLGASGLVPLTKHPVAQMKMTEMGRACGTFEKEDR